MFSRLDHCLTVASDPGVPGGRRITRQLLRESSPPDRVPVLAGAPMFRAAPDLQPIRLSLVRIAATRTAGAAVMDAKLGLAERADPLDDEPDRLLGLGVNALRHDVKHNPESVAPRLIRRWP